MQHEKKSSLVNPISTSLVPVNRHCLTYPFSQTAPTLSLSPSPANYPAPFPLASSARSADPSEGYSLSGFHSIRSGAITTIVRACSAKERVSPPRLGWRKTTSGWHRMLNRGEKALGGVRKGNADTRRFERVEYYFCCLIWGFCGVEGEGSPKGKISENGVAIAEYQNSDSSSWIVGLLDKHAEERRMNAQSSKKKALGLSARYIVHCFCLILFHF